MLAALARNRGEAQQVTLVDHSSEEMWMAYLSRQRPTESTCDVGFLFKHDPPFAIDVTREDNKG